MKILIDTRIWALGLKTPFLTRHDPALEHAKVAQSFLAKILRKDHQLLLSSHLVAEIFDALTQRGNQIPSDQASRFIHDLLDRRGTVFRPVSQEILNRCMALSSRSGIPLWDYLVVFPFEDGIDRIFTIDPHFQDPTLQNLAPVENPLGIWKTEQQEL
jgi:predicted nucleic acid-binding protein